MRNACECALGLIICNSNRVYLNAAAGFTAYGATSPSTRVSPSNITATGLSYCMGSSNHSGCNFSHPESFPALISVEPSGREIRHLKGSLTLLPPTDPQHSFLHSTPYCWFCKYASVHGLRMPHCGHCKGSLSPHG
jgi:hypothetical protein